MVSNTIVPLFAFVINAFGIINFMITIKNKLNQVSQMREIMTHSTLLTTEDLMKDLNMGKATLKFILHRFRPWLTTQIVNDETCYTEQAVTTLLKIKNFLDTGMLPEQIETSLVQEAKMLKATASVQDPSGNQGAIPVGIESVSMFQDMFQVYIEKQDRIALAQESLARIEDRKADAMEKRAAAEEKKAAAMTNIAQALQEMNQRHSQAPEAMEIAGRAVETLALEESPGLDESLLDTNFDEKEDLLEDPVPLEDQFKYQDHEDLGDIGSSNMDDLSLLVNETALTPENIDDLSSLINSVSDPHSDLGDLESLLEESPSAPEIKNLSNDMDDLSTLVDSDLSSSNFPENKAASKGDNENDIDDLFSLVDTDLDAPQDFNENIDDLSKLIEPAGEEAVADLDDLSTLIGEPAQSQAPMDDLARLIEPASDARAGDLDDLSALLEKPTQSQETMDDLFSLVDDTGGKSGQAKPEVDTQTDDLWSLVPDTENSTRKTQNGPVEQSVYTPGMDNLSALINEAPDNSQASADTTSNEKNSFETPTESLTETPSIKPNILPDQDMKTYKAAVMKIIIELKEQGSTPQQTTDRLNRDDVATLSGKPAWGLKAIEKIYGFIDSAK